MNIKWIGAIFIIGGCGCCGFSAAAAGKRETRILQELLNAVRFMGCELQYKLETLPVICKGAANMSSGVVKEVFVNLSRELEWQLEPDAPSCMAEAIEKSHSMPGRVRRLFLQLGASLGRFDLPGQITQLEHLCNSCEEELRICTLGQETRLRSYRTLGLCAGTALAILLL